MVTGFNAHGASAKVTAPRVLAAAVLGLGLVCATAPENAASAGTLITDGTFSLTSLSSPGGFLCKNTSGVGSVCTSNLTDWSATCSASGCAGTSTPASLLFINPSTGDAYVNAWNGGLGLYPTILAPPGGGNVVAIDGGSPYSSSIFQTVNGLTIGDRYHLTFYQGAAQQSGMSGATTEQWGVTFSGIHGSTTLYSQQMNNASQGVVGWSSQSLDFIATSTSEVLTFLAIGSPNGEPPVVLLADVALSDIPEPARLAFLGAGLLAVHAVRRRRAGR